MRMDANSSADTRSDTTRDTTRDTIPDTMFESFYDDDSSTWTLRRVSTIPPEAVYEAEAA